MRYEIEKLGNIEADESKQHYYIWVFNEDTEIITHLQAIEKPMIENKILSFRQKGYLLVRFNLKYGDIVEFK
jgi:hypothetical protein